MTTKHLRNMIAYARNLGIKDAHVKRGGKHPRLLGTTPAGRRLLYILSASPSDRRRWQRNAEADLRRALRSEAP